MSEVKRYGSAVFDSGLIEMACGDYVTYSDYQKLVAERDALVAENACLKQDIDTIAEVMETGTDGALFSAIDEAVGLNTPVTDSVLARIKASELDDLARSIMEYAPVIEADEYYVYEAISKDVTARAANLRAGRKG
ncbi:hypothetical protein [Rahnella inusitata]|uniref:hypothetical protein n=1 Tax=Rahnella inusitata TaxID=58169 RepID=UPI0039BE580D